MSDDNRFGLGYGGFGCDWIWWIIIIIVIICCCCPGGFLGFGGYGCKE